MKQLFLVLCLLAGLTSNTQATPMAWGQPMPERCTSTFVWTSPATYPQYYYADATCAKPWAENAVAFWNWFKEKVNGSGE